MSGDLKIIVLRLAACFYAGKACRLIQAGGQRPLKDMPMWLVGIMVYDVPTPSAGASYYAIYQAFLREWKIRNEEKA